MRKKLLCCLALSNVARGFVVHGPRVIERKEEGRRRRRPLVETKRVSLHKVNLYKPGEKEISVSKVTAVTRQVEGSYELYPSRWLQLFLLSLLALVSDWACFATAAVPSAFQEATGHESATLIDIFLVSNVASCFLYTDISRRLGLRNATVLASGLMFFGCGLRSGLGHQVPAFSWLVAGTILVGVAQPFFQCAPPLLSATWFSTSERSLATATALNANQLGIAAAFVVGAGTVTAPEKIAPYLGTITIAAGVCFLAATFLFRDRPPSPPTASAARAVEEVAEAEAKHKRSGDLLAFPGLLRQLLFETPGFAGPLVAFVASIGVTNVVSSFAGDALDRAASGSTRVGAVGAGFQIAIVLGGIFLGAYVDATRSYKKTTLGCLAFALGTIALLSVAMGYDVNLPPPLVILSIFALGAAVGPVQPLNAELAVEVAHPVDENAIEATQQLAGNLFSALLVPLYQIAGRFDFEFIDDSNNLAPGTHYGYNADFDDPNHIHHHLKGMIMPEPSWLTHSPTDVRGDTVLLFFLVALSAAFFATFSFELKRAALDDAAL